MIYNTLDNAALYMPALKRAFDYILSLSPDTPDGEQELLGREMFARVMRYESKPRAEGRMEAHRRYADIQAVLSGEEIIEWAPLAALSAETAYDSAADVSFYAVPRVSKTPHGRFMLRPGLCAVFMPEDAHMPMLEPAGGPGPVTKVVVKVDMALIDAGASDTGLFD